jgi:hypothetical protein
MWASWAAARSLLELEDLEGGRNADLQPSCSPPPGWRPRFRPGTRDLDPLARGLKFPKSEADVERHRVGLLEQKLVGLVAPADRLTVEKSPLAILQRETEFQPDGVIPEIAVGHASKASPESSSMPSTPTLATASSWGSCRAGSCPPDVTALAAAASPRELRAVRRGPR